MYVELTYEVTMYSWIYGPQTFPAGTVMHGTPISITTVKTRWGYLFKGDYTVVDTTEGAPIKTTRTCNDIRIALAMRRSFAPHPPRIPTNVR